MSSHRPITKRHVLEQSAFLGSLAALGAALEAAAIPDDKETPALIAAELRRLADAAHHAAGLIEESVSPVRQPSV